MWIIPKQLRTLASVADTKESGLDSEEFSQICGRSLWWRGKYSLSKTWLLRWKRVSWIQHLSSRTLKPSLTESFLEKYLSSLEDFPANHFREQVEKNPLLMKGTFSHSSSKESESADPQQSFLKTLKGYSVAEQEMENQFSNMSSDHWKAWVTEQRQEYSQRKNADFLTKESESSSWPTPTIAEVSGGMRLNQIKSGKWGNIQLREKLALMQEKKWATPNTMDVLPPRSYKATQKQAMTSRKGRTNPANLREQVDSTCVQAYKDAKKWPTIQARDWKATSGTSMLRPSTTGKPRGTNGELPLAVYQQSNILLDQSKSNTNGKSQGLLLNPNWVEQLMGLPVGWTQLPTEPKD